ncbi:MAG: FIST N-terminal domain-containing protein [Myxococcota bacterium]|nr:FIST N-terminal domain-containing protein [Myxococcota bacterium]
MRVASALSQHVETSQAVVQALESIHRELEGADPDLLVLFVSEHHTRRFDAIARSLRDTWPRTCLIGCGASSVIGAGREIEGTPSIGLLAARLPGVELAPFHIEADALADPPAALRERLCAPPPAGAGATSVLLLADPYSSGTDVLLAGLDRALPGASVLGGVASGSPGPGRAALVAGDASTRQGWVGATMHGAIDFQTVVAQGCRPIGTPMFVTRGQDNLIHELDGHPPMQIVQQLFEEGDARERALIQSSLFIGIQMQAGRTEYGQGDFLVRNLAGADEDTGAIAVGAEIDSNFVVQFHLRDAHTASEDLELALRSRTRLRERLRGALLFSCLGRGRGLYGIENHDSDLLNSHLGPVPLAGFFGNGEIGQVEGRTYLHSYTSAFGLLCEPEAAPRSVARRLQ